MYLSLPNIINPVYIQQLGKMIPPPSQILWESATRSPFSSFTTLVLGWYPLLNSLIPLYKSLIFLFLLFVSSSLILAFRYSFFLFLKCLLASCLTLCRLSPLFWFGSCNH